MLTLKIVGDPVNLLTAGHCSKLFHGATKINSYLNTKTLICDLPLAYKKIIQRRNCQ
jgi:hypothetical protein